MEINGTFVQTCTAKLQELGTADQIVQYISINKWAIGLHYFIILLSFLIFGAFNDNYEKGTYWVFLIVITIAFGLGEVFAIGWMYN